MAQSSSEQEKGAIDLMQLPLDALLQLRSRLDEETQQLGRAFQRLKGAAGRHKESKEALGALKHMEPDAEVLVPLTSSLYVPAKVEDRENVLLDIGTDFVVEKSIPQSQEYMDRKIHMLKQKLEALSQTVLQKQKQLEIVSMVLASKAQAQQELQQQGRER